MKLESVIGNTDVINALQTSLKTGTLPHAVLITAPDGCARGFVSRCLAADYLFPNGGTGAQAVVNNESSEVLLVEGEGRSGQIPIERIRNVRNDIFHSSLSAAGRVVLIKDAHNMMAPSANALLKVLEEPPAEALFILSAKDAALLPQTIVSRCALYPLAPVSVELCNTKLAESLHSQESQPLALLLSTIYGGRIGTCLHVLKNPERYAILKDALQLVEAASCGNLYAMLRIFSFYEGRADGDREKREALLSDTTDVLACSLRGTFLEEIPVLSPQQVALFVPEISKARLQLRANASPKTVFSSLGILLNRASKI